MTINWRKPIEWSTGAAATVGELQESGVSYKAVSPCAEWTQITGGRDNIAVDSETGCVLGCEDDYPFIRNVDALTDFESVLCEAAACLWEEALALLQKNDPEWLEAQQSHGYSSLRYDVIQMARACHEDWLVAEKAGYDDPFDWEFVPAWLAANVVWIDIGPRLRSDRVIPELSR